MRRRTMIMLWVLAGLAGGCSRTPVSQGGFNSPDPASKLYAITRAGQDMDVSAVPNLVEQLDSDDAAVRMLSIMALEKITGTRLGYDWRQGAAERRPAIEQWVEATRSGRFRLSAR